MVGSPFAALGGLFVIVLAMFLLARLRAPNETEGADRYLRRTDLLDEGRAPTNPFEWIIVIAADTRVHMAAFLMLAGVSILLAITGRTAAAALGMYGTILTMLVLLLFGGWDRLEAFFGVRTPEPANGEPDPDDLPAHVKAKVGAVTDIGRRTPGQRGYGELKVTIVLVVLLALFVAVTGWVFEMLI